MENRVVLITGGAQGIGKISALQLLENNWNVAVIDVDEEAIDELNLHSCNDNLLCIHADISSEEHIQLALEQIITAFGRIDALVNNAVQSYFKPLSQLTLDEWNLALAVNLTAPFLLAKYAETELRKNKGSIINICSTRAMQSEANTESYTATKGGLLSLTHALAVSLGPDVRVNAISPGWIDVSAIRKKSTAQQIELSAEDHSQHPAGRVGEGKDIANMIEFLLNPANSFITGQNFVIDGGMTKKMIYV